MAIRLFRNAEQYEAGSDKTLVDGASSPSINCVKCILLFIDLLIWLCELNCKIINKLILCHRTVLSLGIERWFIISKALRSEHRNIFTKESKQQLTDTIFGTSYNEFKNMYILLPLEAFPFLSLHAPLPWNKHFKFYTRHCLN